MAKTWLLVDLTYGDAAKGATVDFLARREPVRTVVRFNGGPQAGHNVVTPDGRHHTFSQFGSASFVPGVLTYLSRYMLVNPLNAFREAAHLRAVGVPDALERLVVHPDCLVITPYHVAANRLRELARGTNRHGSCGMGIGETVADSLAFPEEALRIRDLAFLRVVTHKLQAVRERKRREFRALVPQFDAGLIHSAATSNSGRETSKRAATSDFAEAVYTFFDPHLIGLFAERARAFAELIILQDEGWLRARLRDGVTVFEPAQGTLIDEDQGFHPHTTWSKTTLANAEALLQMTDFAGEVTRVGLLRTYSTRHGAGPFVPEDAEMTALLPDQYNPPGDWQGRMRCGPFDFVATRYALAANPGVDWLAISHLDALDEFACGWPLCQRYEHEGAPQAALAAYDRAGRVSDLRLPPQPDLAHQERLTQLLEQCVPIVEQAHRDQLVDLVEQELGRPVGLCAWGPTASDRALTRRAGKAAGAVRHPRLERRSA